MSNVFRLPLLRAWHEACIATGDVRTFLDLVSARYTTGSLARLTTHGDRFTRRAAVFALGELGEYDMNPVLGLALIDSDRGVRLLADTAIQNVWRRAGSSRERRRLENLIRLNNDHRYLETIEAATILIEHAPWLAEAWHQRSIAFHAMKHFREAIHDCEQTLEINPYHFPAATRMGQCHLMLGHRSHALESLQRALKLNPDLEGVRAKVAQLERSLQNE